MTLVRAACARTAVCPLEMGRLRQCAGWRRPAHYRRWVPPSPRLGAPLPDQLTVTARLGHQTETHAAFLPSRLGAIGQQVQACRRRDGFSLGHSLTHVDHTQRPKRKTRVGQYRQVQRGRGDLQRQRRQRVTGLAAKSDAVVVATQPRGIERGSREGALDAWQCGRIAQPSMSMAQQAGRRNKRGPKCGRTNDRQNWILWLRLPCAV